MTPSFYKMGKKGTKVTKKIILFSEDGYSLGIPEHLFIETEFGTKWNANKTKMKKSQNTIQLPFKLSSIYLFFFGSPHSNSTETDFADETNCLFYLDPSMINQCKIVVGNFIAYHKTDGFSWVDVESTELITDPFTIDLKIQDRYEYTFEYDINRIIKFDQSIMFESNQCFSSEELIWTTYFLLKYVNESEDLNNHNEINKLYQNLCLNFRADWLTQLYTLPCLVLLNLNSLWIERITDESIIEKFAQLFHEHFVDFDLSDPDCFNHFSIRNDFTYISNKYMKALLKISPHYIKLLQFWNLSKHPACSCFLIDKDIILLYLKNFDFSSKLYPFLRELFEVFDSIGFSDNDASVIISKFVATCRNWAPPQRLSYQKSVKSLMIAEIGKQIHDDPAMPQLNVLLSWLNILTKQ
jgi:hypothetical protein